MRQYRSYDKLNEGTNHSKHQYPLEVAKKVAMLHAEAYRK
jgi:hypothetical protein